MGRVASACAAVLLGALAFSSIAGAITNGGARRVGHPEVGALLAPVAYSDGHLGDVLRHAHLLRRVFLTAAHCDPGREVASP